MPSVSFVFILEINSVLLYHQNKELIWAVIFLEIKAIAKIYTDFPDKFGIPRQSGLVDSLVGKIVFEPQFRNPDAVRGLEDFSHLWLLWYFSESHRDNWSPTVRPPRLGGNERVGVFASRSPFRPNPIGLSSVKIIRIEQDEKLGPVIYVAGADILNETPIFDIKPYLPISDCHPDAVGGFSDEHKGDSLEVQIYYGHLDKIPEDKRKALVDILSQDPRPSYQNDPERIYGMSFSKFEIKFSVDGDVLTVLDILEN